jgi:hypothetical protein
MKILIQLLFLLIYGMHITDGSRRVTALSEPEITVLTSVTFAARSYLTNYEHLIFRYQKKVMYLHLM